jgi:hypothetical protein
MSWYPLVPSAAGAASATVIPAKKRFKPVGLYTIGRFEASCSAKVRHRIRRI